MTGRDWSSFRPGHFDRALLGKREPVAGLFAKSEAQQLDGQAMMFGDEDSEPEPGPDESDCLRWQ